MIKSKTVIKTNGKVEVFDPNKLSRSLIETFNIAKIPSGQAENLSQKTIREFRIWQQNKPEITTRDIRLQIAKILEISSPEAAYIFKNFKNMM